MQENSSLLNLLGDQQKLSNFLSFFFSNALEPLYQKQHDTGGYRSRRLQYQMQSDGAMRSLICFLHEILGVRRKGL